MTFKIRNYLSVCLVSFLFLVNCTSHQPDLLQEASISPEIFYVGKSALDLFPIANDLASEIIPNPLLFTINVSLPANNPQQTSLITAFHFEAIDTENLIVVITCENNDCHSDQLSSTVTYLANGNKPIDVNDILIDSTDVFQVALTYLDSDLNQFNKSHLRLATYDQEGLLWTALFIDLKGDGAQLKISPQSGDIIEVLEF